MVVKINRSMIANAVAVLAVVAVTVDTVTKVEPAICGKNMLLADCIQKSMACGPLEQLLQPLMGDPATISSCAMKSGTPLKSKFYTSFGMSMASGSSSPSSSSSSLLPSTGIADELTSNTIADAAIRECVLNATGMLTPSMTLDRNAIAEQVSLLSPPSLGASVVAGVQTCPEPINFKISSFIKCLKKVCIASAVIPTVPLPSYF